MSHNVQELIDKIKQEGLEASRKTSEEIEAQAQKKAEEIVTQAKAKLEKMLSDAEDRQKKLEAATRATLQQAARDTVLTLKQTVNDLLTRIIRQDIRDALGKEQMSALIVELAKGFVAQNTDAAGVEIGLSEESRQLLEKDLLAKLQREIKVGVTVRTADDLGGGFTISFDDGKSCFDFSEKALVEYLGRQVNEYVKGILKM